MFSASEPPPSHPPSALSCERGRLSSMSADPESELLAPKLLRAGKSRIHCLAGHHLVLCRNGRCRRRHLRRRRAAQPLPIQEAHSLRLLFERRRAAGQRIWRRHLALSVSVQGPNKAITFAQHAALGRHVCVCTPLVQIGIANARSTGFREALLKLKSTNSSEL